MPDTSTYNYIFGPVHSRRLGRSLGIDLIPAKTCSYNCLYCQLGVTSALTIDRRAYVPVDAVRRELECWWSAGGRADVVTLAGSGEPTLHTGFGEILRVIHQVTGMPSVLLSNGSLFHLPEVRRDAMEADVVKVTLSAWDEPSFQRLHRPHSGLSFTAMWEGERQFRKEYKGQLWVEVFIVPGVNDGDDAARALAGVVAALRPDRVQLNTAVRAPAEEGVQAASPDRLRALAAFFTPEAEIPDQGQEPDAAGNPSLPDLVSRHPMTAEQIAAAFGMDLGRVEQDLLDAVREGVLEQVRQGAQCFYRRKQTPTSADNPAPR